MQIKAITSIIEWDADLGQMVVLNAGDNGQCGANLARNKLAEGAATAADDEAKALAAEIGPVEKAKAPPRAAARKKAKAGPNPLTEARKRYKAAIGKGASPKWDVATIDAKIAEAAAANSGDAGDDAPPAA